MLQWRAVSAIDTNKYWLTLDFNKKRNMLFYLHKASNT